MKKSSLAKVLLAFVVVFAGCDSADLTKAPVLKRKQSTYYLYSQDDETVIKDIKAFGRNGECRVVFDIWLLDIFVNTDKIKEYLKASGLKMDSDNSTVECRKKDGSIEKVLISDALVLKDGTCVYKPDYKSVTIKEYNELVSKLSETTWQYRDRKEPLLGKPLVYNHFLDFWLEDCKPKNGKYEIKVKTNFGTFDYEIAGR